MVSNDAPSAPWSSISDSSSRPTSFSVRPGRSPPRSTRVRERRVGRLAGQPQQGDFPGVLDLTQSFHSPGRPHQLDGVAGRLGERGECVDGDHVAFEAQPAHTVGGGAGGQVRSTCPLDDDLGVGRLLRGLGAISPVGGQHRRVALSARINSAAFEPVKPDR